MYVYLLVFPHPGEQKFYMKHESSLYSILYSYVYSILYTNTLKAKQSLYYTYAQESFASKVGFFPQSRNRRSDHLQTLRPAFLVDFSGIPKPKNQCTRPHGHLGNAYPVVWKVSVTCTYANVNEEQPGGFAGRVEKL